jgi:tRNA threonylcarbamoyladenosine biosynthesis protein TsaE
MGGQGDGKNSAGKSLPGRLVAGFARSRGKMFSQLGRQCRPNWENIFFTGDATARVASGSEAKLRTLQLPWMGRLRRHTLLLVHATILCASESEVMSDQYLPAVQGSHELDFISHSPAQTERIGQRLGELLHAGDLVLLIGPFGAGKTNLVKGLVRGLGSSDLVTSPSFVLVNEYQGRSGQRRLPVHHVDLYRMASTDEVATIGLEELCADDSACLIEWPDLARDLLPDERLEIFLQHVSETKRRIRLLPIGSRYIDLVNLFKESTFG